MERQKVWDAACLGTFQLMHERTRTSHTFPLGCERKARSHHVSSSDYVVGISHRPYLNVSVKTEIERFKYPHRRLAFPTPVHTQHHGPD